MKLLGLEELQKFYKKHRVAQRELENWRAFMERADWADFSSLVQEYPKVRYINKGRVVFKIRESWRIDVFIEYTARVMLIKRVGTHEEYNRWRYDD